jgi:hypothetical protein
MIIELRNFGNVLTSRPSGRKAILAYRSKLDAADDQELVTLDCSDVSVLSPAWADEFLTPLHARFDNRLTLTNTKNASVAMTIEVLEETNGIKFRVE